MPIYVGGNLIKDIKIGSTAINSVWIGGSRVWSRTLINPESGWNSGSGSQGNDRTPFYSNTVTIVVPCTLKFTMVAHSGQTGANQTVANSGHTHTYQTNAVEVNTGSGWPGLTSVGGWSIPASPYRWGYAGVSYGSSRTISLNVGDQVRLSYHFGESATFGGSITRYSFIKTTTTVQDNATQQIIDSNIVANFTYRFLIQCFPANSQVTLQDLSTKAIADINEGDLVLGDGGVINQVIELREHAAEPRTIYSINHLQTTAAHPIKTDQGWKAIDADAASEMHPDLSITTIAVGDKLIQINYQGVETATEITHITSETIDAPVYNLNVSGLDTPDIDGNDTYIVDAVVVHNK